jgi:hypothetical protein
MAERLSHYELIERLGSGGMGAVWRARDMQTGSEVAIKVLHPHLEEDAAYVARFEREAQIASGIASPNVVKVLASGEDGGSHFLVMEYVQGRTLAQVIQRDGPLPIDRAVDYSAGIANGLAAANSEGIIHRDVSPQNVIVTPAGVVKVTDFGVARDTGQASLTATSAVLGKPQYIAPEVVTGRAKADIRSDIYSLGVVLYQMLTGYVPFHSDTPWNAMMKHVSEPPPSPASVRPDLPPWLVALTLKCLSKEPGERYQTPEELADALRDQRGPDLPPDSAASAPESLAAAADEEVSGRHILRRLAGLPRLVLKIARVLAAPLIVMMLLTVIGLLAMVILALLPTSLPTTCPAADNATLPIPVPSDANVSSFDAKLDEFIELLDGGSPATVTFTNDEVTSKAVSYLQSTGIGSFSEISVCLEPRGASLAAVYKPSALKSLKLYADASLHLAEAPSVHLDGLKVGRLPAIGPVRSTIEGIVNDLFEGIEIDYQYEVTYDYNAVTINGIPTDGAH